MTFVIPILWKFSMPSLANLFIFKKIRMILKISKLWSVESVSWVSVWLWFICAYDWYLSWGFRNHYVLFITLVCEKLLSICHVLERKNSECISFVSWIWTCLEHVELNFTFVSAMFYLLHWNLMFINHWIHLSISILVLFLMLWCSRSLRQFSLKALDWVIVVFSIFVLLFLF